MESLGKENNPPEQHQGNQDPVDMASQQSLMARNTAISTTSPKQKSHEQTQLVEKFKKLRQWQQQQQESLLRQQQQQIETVKMGQSKLQGILAAQRLLYEQSGHEHIAALSPKLSLRPTGSLNMVQDSTSERGLIDAARHAVMVTRTPEGLPSERLGAQNLPNPLGHYVPANTGAADVVSPGMPNTLGYSPHSGVIPCLAQLPPGQLQYTEMDQPAAPQGRLLMDRASAVLSDIGYPVPWSSSNFQLPLGSIPLASNPLSQQRPPLYVSGSSDAQVSAMMGRMGEVLPATVAQVAVNQVITMTTPHTDGHRSSPSGSSQPGDLESQDDDLSEVEVMSGVYPMDEDSCSEIDLNETGDKGQEGAESGHSREHDTSEEDSDYDVNQSVNVTVIEEQLSPHGDQDPESVQSDQVVDDEERPINPGIGTGSSVRTFEELLEEQLQLEQIKSAPAVSVSPPKPQKTFLRKGQGLARFRGKKAPSKGTTKGSVKQPSGPKISSQLSAAQTKLEADVNMMPADGNCGLPSKLTRKVAGRTIPPTSSGAVASCTGVPPRIPVDHQTKAPYITKSMQSTPGSRQCTSLRSGLLPRISSINNSFQMRMQDLDQVKEIEDEDLEEFEMLEQAAAANASFSSNSSVVVRVLQKARVRNQADSHGNSHKDCLAQDGPGGLLSPVDTGYGSGEGRGVPGTDSAEFSANPPEGQTDAEDSEADITLVEMNEDPQGGEGTYGERGSSHKASQMHKGSNTATLSPLSEAFDDEETWDDMRESDTESSDDSDVTISDLFPVVASTPPLSQKPSVENKVMTSTPPTSALISKLFPQLKPKVRESKEQAVKLPEKSLQPANETLRSNGNKDVVTFETVQSTAIREKLQELENEIERFRAENVNIEKLKVDRVEGLKRLQDEITSFENQKAQELERLHKFKEEELQKLRKEKRVFEKYHKASRAVPDKKEREEIEILKTQVTELQEELKRRESRWSAASARHRNRVESLEQRNKELQEEVKLLEQYRLKQETAKIKGAEEAHRVLHRKSTRTVEEDGGVKAAPSHRAAPRKTTFVETVLKPVQDDTFSPVDRESMSKTDTNNNKNQPNVDESLPGEDDRRIDGSPRKTRKSLDNGQKHQRVQFNENRIQIAGNKVHATSVEKSGNQEAREIVHADGKVERINTDGSRVIMFSNGTKKEMSADGKTLTVTFFNGDIKQILPDQRVMYYYADAQTTHTTFADGLEVLQFPNNQIEKHYPDDTKEIIFPDQTIKYLHPRGTEECVFADGTIQRLNSEGERTIEFPNGQREIHTKHFKKREYPDGTIKTVFPDGRTETRYATGRLRVKDRDGHLLVDTADPNR